MSVCKHIKNHMYPNFTKFSVYVACGHSLILQLQSRNPWYR